MYSTIPQLLFISASSLENNKQNDRSSDFAFKLLPTPKEETSAAPTRSNYGHTSKDAVTADSQSDDDYATYSESWADMTTDVESYVASTTVASGIFSELPTPDSYDVVSSTNAPLAPKPGLKIDSIMTTPTIPRTLTSRSRFVFNIIRTTSAMQNKHLTRNSVDKSTTTKTSRDSVGDPPSTIKGRVVTTSNRIRISDVLPENKRRPSSAATDPKIKSVSNDGETYSRPTSIHEYEHITDGNVTDTPIILPGYSPSLWHDWHWILIALVLFIFIFLIPGFFCQICLAKRRKVKRAAKNNEKAEEDDSQSACGSYASDNNSTQEENRPPAGSAESSLPNDPRETDQCQSTNNDLSSTTNSQDIPVVITIPDPMQVDEASRHDSTASKRKIEHPLPDNYDVRLEIGKETIIKSADPVRKREKAEKAHHTRTAKYQQGPRREKRRNEAPKRTEVHSNRHKMNPREELSKKKRTRPSRKLHRRGDTRTKISDSTKSILEAARDLDGILAAITSLTHEYPIPEYSETRKRERMNEKPQDSKLRRRPIENSAEPEQNARSRRVKGEVRSKKLQNVDKRNMKSSRRNKKQKRTKEKSKATDEKTHSKKKVPTLVKEELPTVDAVKNEQRRRRLERDLKKLQNYHNTQFSNT